MPFALGFKGTMNALGARNSKIANPLYTRYWSMVPYQLGLGVDRQAVKYSVRNCSTVSATLPDHLAIIFTKCLKRYIAKARRVYGISYTAKNFD